MPMDKKKQIAMTKTKLLENVGLLLAEKRKMVRVMDQIRDICNTTSTPEAALVRIKTLINSVMS